jgi:hypothetical protein
MDETLYKLFRSKYTGKQLEDLLARISTFSSQLTDILDAIHRIDIKDSNQDADIDSLEVTVGYMRATDQEHTDAIATLRSLLSNTIQFENFTQEEYEHAQATNALQPKWYFIFQDYQYRRLMRIYYYGTLVARRGDGEVSSGFPYIFPIVF